MKRSVIKGKVLPMKAMQETGLTSAGGLAARKQRQGFTLIELLVVIAIISILASLLLPVLMAAKTKAQATQCLANFKQMQVAWALYNQDHPDFLAPNCDTGNNGKSTDDPSWVAGTMTFNNDPVSVDEATNMD